MEPRALGTDVIPGTVHLVDRVGTLNVKHDGKGGHKDVVLLPQPTKEHHDPLNWSRVRKLLNANVLLLAVFMGDIMVTLLSAALLVIREDTGISVADLNQGIGVMFLFFGWSNVFWQPLGLTIGRRPVILLALLGVIAMSVWTAFVSSRGEWYANRVLIGCCYGPLETLIEICLSDIFFVHERGFWIGMYSWVLVGVPFLGSIPAGFVASNLGWEWIQYIASIIAGGFYIVLFFCMEETMFYRLEPVQEEIAVDAADIGRDGECSSVNANGASGKDSYPEVTDIEKSPNIPPTEADLGEVALEKKSFLQKLKFWGARRPGQPNNFYRSLWVPFSLVRFPVILFSGVLVGSNLMWSNALNGTMSLILSAPPYAFSANMVGVMFTAPFIGCTIGCILAGWFSDMFAVWMARRNGGIFEPEHRLWLAIVPLIFHAAGSILFGVGAQHGVHWMGLAFGLVFMVGMMPLGNIVAINYIVDSYREVAGDAMVTMILIRSSMGFGFNYAVTPWLEKSGVQNLYIAIAFIGMFFWGLAFFFIWLGKRTRQLTAKDYWTMVERYGLSAH